MHPARWWSVFASLLLCVGLMLPSSARAQDVCTSDEQATPSIAARLDQGFADWVVSPIGTVLFFDIAFWDNTLNFGDLPSVTPDDSATQNEQERALALKAGLATSGAELRSFDTQNKAYVYRCRTPARLRDVVPVVPEGRTIKRGLLELTLTEDAGQLWGTWQQTDVDPVGLGLVAAEGVDPDAEQPGTSTVVSEESAEDAVEEPHKLMKVELEILAPFAVVVDVTSGHVQAGKVALPWSALPMQAGDHVTYQGVEHEVALVSGTKVNLRSLNDEQSTDSLANSKQISLPFVVLWLVIGALFFTVRFGLINVRAFGHAILVTSGRYDNEDDEGEVSHFQALSSALSATVGLGNIAGVAVAVTLGGPGAVVWMVVAALLGMSSKFTEVTLGQMYRVIKKDGSVSGGPMHYLSKGLADMGLKPLGYVLAVMFAIMCIGGSLGGGNMFQGNQSFQAIADVAPLLKPSATGSVVFERLDGVQGEIKVPADTLIGGSGGPGFTVTEDVVIAADQQVSVAVVIAAVRGGYEGNIEAGTIDRVLGLVDNKGKVQESALDDSVSVSNAAATAGGGSYGFFYGIVLTVIVGLVIVGGIKRIGTIAGIIVPAMAILYVLAGLYIMGANWSAVPDAFGTMFSSAFSLEAGFGGLVGVLITGFQRASFSNEAGVGSASIAHSAAATNEPVREGIVALLEPFIDTVVICTMTGIVVIVTGAYEVAGIEGISMTSHAFEHGGLPGAKYVLAIAVTLFAFSTMISWSYYGERATLWLFGDWALYPYKVLFLVCVLAGPVFTLGNVIGFSDLMILGMAFPNILGLYILSNKVAKALKAYMGKLKRGEFQAR
ncbi:MAG: Na+/alanine symporter [Kiritimatiellia bacterium]|jgi:Na+/alanine symporter